MARSSSPTRWPAVLLLTLVFLVGAASLVIEVTALRLLAPYFGNTIFVSSSVISVILLALSLGYWLGGRLADRCPTVQMLCALVVLSGLGTLLIGWLTVLLLPYLGETFSIASGPLLAAVALFFLPALALGTVSPFVIRLLHDQSGSTGVGTLSGQVFFWSTTGSVLGTLAAAYLLIPNSAIGTIFWVTGLLLCTVGGLPLIYLRTRRRTRAIIGSTILIALLSTGNAAQPAPAGLLFQHNGTYEQITISESPEDEPRIRALQLDRNNSSARYLASDEHVYPYTRYYRLHELLVDDLNRALVLGGGAYVVPASLIADEPEVVVDVVEIEPRLYDLAQEFFGLKPSNRLHNIVADGRRYLHDTSHRYDLIFSDIYYSLHTIPAHMTTIEFFGLLKSRLTDGGIVVANLIGTLDTSAGGFVPAEIKTFQAVFPNHAVYVVDNPTSPEVLQNVILLGINGDRRIEADRAQTANDPILQELAAHSLNSEGWDQSSTPVLTDQRAPVEYMMARTLIAGH